MSSNLLTALVRKPLFLAVTTTCPFCKNAISLAKSKGVTPEVVELDVRKEGADLRRELSAMTEQTTVPYVFSFNNFVGGFDQLKKQPDAFWDKVRKG